MAVGELQSPDLPSPRKSLAGCGFTRDNRLKCIISFLWSPVMPDPVLPSPNDPEETTDQPSQEPDTSARETVDLPEPTVEEGLPPENPSAFQTVDAEPSTSEGYGSRSAPLPQSIAQYEILSELGRGAMGVVYKARQKDLDRLVALKMILAGSHAGEDQRGRFLTEAKAVASLQHPNIVQIYEIGEHEDKPFFSLEFVEGDTLDERIRENAITAHQAASLIATMARAMSYAHERGIVHRDLKPANVLLTQEGEPKITDFGLAKQMEDSSGQTQSGAIMGTPSFMSPEQALGQTKEIGPCSDVYALGAMIYDMLTGRPPFRASSVLDTLEQVRRQEPAPPRQFQSTIPVDLETICLKCLRKDPRQRYDSAMALAEDVERYLRGEPIAARPVGRLERAYRWSRRNPVVAALMTTVAILLLSGTAIGWSLTLVAWAERDRADGEALKATQQKQRAIASAEEAGKQQAMAEEQAREALKQKKIAEEQSRETRRLLGQMALNQASDFFEKGDLFAGLTWLSHSREAAQGIQEIELAARQQFYSHWKYQYSPQLMHLLTHSDMVVKTAVSPNGNYFLTGSADRTAQLWDARTCKPLHDPVAHNGSVVLLGISPDSRYFVSGGQYTARISEVGTGKTLSPTLSLKGMYRAIFTPDSARLIGEGERSIRIWSAPDGKPLGPELKLGGALGGSTGGLVGQIVLHPDGKRLLIRETFGGARIYDISDPKKLKRLINLQSKNSLDVTMEDAAFSPNGRYLAVTWSNGNLNVFDLVTLKGLGYAIKHRGIKGAIFSPNSELITTRGSSIAKVWNVKTGKEVGAPRAHRRPVRQIDWSPDGRKIATASSDGTARVWEVLTGDPVTPPLRHRNFAREVFFTPTGRQLLTCGMGSSARLWDLTTPTPGPEAMAQQKELFNPLLSPDGRRYLSQSKVGSPFSRTYGAYILDAKTRRKLSRPMTHSSRILKMAWSPNGRFIVTTSYDRSAKVWTSTGRAIGRALYHQAPVGFAAFDQSGNRLITTSYDGGASLWHPYSGRRLSTLRHRGRVHHAAFSPVDGLIVTAGNDFTARLWSTNGKPVARPLEHQGEVVYATFSPDGTKVATASNDGTARIWEVKTGKPLGPALEHPTGVFRVAFSPNGLKLLCVCRNRTVRAWDAITGLPLTPLLPYTLSCSVAGFSKNGKRILVVSKANRAQQWHLKSDDRSLQDWETIARTGSSHQVDQFGALVPLSDEELIQSYQRLQAIRTGSDTSPLRQQLQWHQREAKVAEKEKHPAAAFFHYLHSAPAWWILTGRPVIY